MFEYLLPLLITTTVQTPHVSYSVYLEKKNSNLAAEQQADPSDYSVFKYNSWNAYQHVKNATGTTKGSIAIVLSVLSISTIMILIESCKIDRTSNVLYPLISLVTATFVTSRALFHYKKYVPLASLLQHISCISLVCFCGYAYLIYTD